MMLSHALWTVLLSCRHTWGQRDGQFVTPPYPEGLTASNENNLLWSIGATYDVEWTSSYDTYSLDLFQFNLTSLIGYSQGSIFCT